MAWKVLIAHAKGEEHLAEKLAEPVRAAGYEVAHQGTVLVGESVVEEASKVLSLGGPVVLCGTVVAVGTGWAHKLVNAARRHSSGVRVFPVQMEKNAYLESISFEAHAALYWQDPSKAVDDLLAALSRYYPPEEAEVQHYEDAEERYRSLMLETCDIVNLATLPEYDPIMAQRQLELRRLYVPLRAWVDVKADYDEDYLIDYEGFYKAHFKMEVMSRKRQRVPVGELLAEVKRMVVLGEPGAGKSTLTRWIATAYLMRLNRDPDLQDLPDVKTLPDEDWLPILVQCRDLNERCISGNLDDILSHTLRKAELTEAEASALLQVLKRRLKDGTALLMLDGLDEISESRTRASFCQHLERVHVAYPKAPIIVTSRIAGYRDMGYRLGRGFEHATLADLDTEEKDDFARRWCKLTERPERWEDAARELIQNIHSSDRIERMTGNPMVLTTMALVKRKVGKLPSRRADLYLEAVQVLLYWRSEVDEPLDQREAIPQLEYIAYTMCDRGVQQLREDDVLDIIAKMRAEYPNMHQSHNHTPEEFLHILEARTGLLVEAGRPLYRGMSIPVYEFRHLTFQEYLAARALAYSRFPERNSTRSLAEQVSHLASRTENVAVKGIETKDVVENWREALRLCTVICSDDDVDDVLQAILTPLDGEPETNRRARAMLAVLCVADEPNVSEETVQDVFQAYASQVKEEDEGGQGGTSFRETAMEVARTRWAVQLCTSLVNEYCRRDATNRVEVGSLCGRVGANCAPKDLIEREAWLSEQVDRIKNGDEHVAIETALIVGRLAFENNALDEEHRFRFVPGLVDALLFRLEGSAPMAHAAAMTLRSLNRGPIVTEYTKKDWRLKPDQIEHILAFIGKSDAYPEAVNHLACVIGDARIEAANEPLLAWLDHPNPNFRRDVAEALGRIGNERAVEPLIAMLDDPEGSVRLAVVGALGRIGDILAVKPLICKLDDPNDLIKWNAIKALGRIGDKLAVEPLIAKLEYPNDYVRSAAADALREIDGDR